MRVSEIRVKRIRVNQGLGVSPIIKENAMILKFLENLAVEDHPAPSY